MGYSICAFFYGILAIFSAVRYKNSWFFWAALSSVIWSLLHIPYNYPLSIHRFFFLFPEWCRLFFWQALLLSILSAHFREESFRQDIKKIINRMLLLLTLLSFLFLILQIAHFFSFSFSFFFSLRGQNFYLYLSYILFTIFSVLNIWLSELIIKNISFSSRWRVKFICIPIIFIFSYDFIFFSLQLLILKNNYFLEATRLIINTFVVPIFFIGFSREEKHHFPLSISHKIIYKSTVLFFASLYLLFVSFFSTFIQLSDEKFSDFLKILLTIFSFLLLVLVFFSGKIQAKIKVFLRQNFFRYQYDYRNEWNELTNSLTLTQDMEDILDASLFHLTEKIQAQGGAIWLYEEQDFFLKKDSLFKFECNRFNASRELMHAWEKKEWIIDIKDNGSYNQFMLDLLPSTLRTHPKLWLVIPLIVQQSLIGIVALAEARTKLIKLNWESFDLLKIVSRQLACHLAQKLNGEALSSARQFVAVHQTTSFLVHDIKTVLSQLNLLVSNAQKHKNNAEFMSDMVMTTAHSAAKLTQVLSHFQVHENQKTLIFEQVDLVQIIQKIIRSKNLNLPKPQFIDYPQSVFFKTAPKKIESIINQLIINAIEATPSDGKVEITLIESEKSIIVNISDTGCGIDPFFLKHDLFKPYMTTKGLSGMGLGAYQSRLYARELGGDIVVVSEKGKGSIFRLILPKKE